MKKKTVVCVGAALIDESYHCSTETLPGTSNPANFYKSPGGVARNIAHHLALLGETVELISHFGNDSEGKWMMEQCTRSGIGISSSLVNNVDTGRYVALLTPNGDLFAGAVSTHFDTLITPEFLQSKTSFLKKASLIVFDCNLSEESIHWLAFFCQKESIPYIIEPVSVTKSARLINADLKKALLITPNVDEMLALTGTAKGKEMKALIQSVLERGVKYLWIRKGKQGSALYSTDFSFELEAPNVNVIDSTGAGDAALAGWIHAWLSDESPEECVRHGHAMAALVLQVKGAINVNLNPSLHKKMLNNK